MQLLAKRDKRKQANTKSDLGWLLTMNAEERERIPTATVGEGHEILKEIAEEQLEEIRISVRSRRE